MLHPKVAFRDCNECLKWQYDEETGEIKQRHGQPMRRISKPWCMIPNLGCPKGHIDNPKGLSPKNIRAWGHYLECRAVGKFPEDATVRRNAGIIRSVEDAVERSKRDELLLYMRSVMRGIAVRG